MLNYLQVVLRLQTFYKVKIPIIQSIEVILWTEMRAGHTHWLTNTSIWVPFYMALEVNIAWFSSLFPFQPSSCVKIDWTVSLRKLNASLQTSECVNLSFKLTDITCIIHCTIQRVSTDYFSAVTSGSWWTLSLWRLKAHLVHLVTSYVAELRYTQAFEISPLLLKLCR